MTERTIHGTAVAIGARACLILGPSGAGKSSLALDLMARGAGLVADDRVVLSADAGGLTVAAPPSLAGWIEWRGVGLLEVPRPHPAARLALVVDLGEMPSERLPVALSWSHLEHTVPRIAARNVPALAAGVMLLLTGARLRDPSRLWPDALAPEEDHATNG